MARRFLGQPILAACLLGIELAAIGGASAEAVPVNRTLVVARTLEVKTEAFQAASTSGDLGTTLRCQRELLAAARDATGQLSDDTSPTADAVRYALVAIHEGAAGDPAWIEVAEVDLHWATSGGGSTPPAAVHPPPRRPESRPALDHLADALAEFQATVREGNARAALRLQEEILDTLAVAEPSFQWDQSDRGRLARLALSDLRAGLDGDPYRMKAASQALARLRTWRV